MDYTNNACGPAEVAPRSPHHAAMLLLERRTAQLSKLVDALSATLEPALRQREPQPDDAVAMPKSVQSNVQVIAHVDGVCSVVDSCIDRVDSLLNRLVI